MAVHNANLSKETTLLNRNIQIWIVISEFNEEISTQLLNETLTLLEQEWFTNVDVYSVPWAFEIPALTSKILDKWIYTVLLTLWVVIKWSTPHFDYICTECCRWIMDLSLAHDTPVILWVLTCDTYEQAKRRANNNYAIYALNYLAQRTVCETNLHSKYSSLLEQMNKELTQKDE